MKNLNRLCKGMVSLLLGGFLMTSCQSEDFSGSVQAEEKGTIMLTLNAMEGFETETKAISDIAYAEYLDVNNYTIEISDLNNRVETSFKYSDRSDRLPYELKRGSYTVKAYYGEIYKDRAASQDGFYVVDAKNINVDSNQEYVSLTCVPVHARVETHFDSAMSSYYSDFYVTYSTNALRTKGETVKSNDHPWYLLVDEDGEEVEATIVLTPKEGYQTGSTAKLTQKYRLKPNQAWTLGIAPNYSATETEGSVSISITIDDQTNDVDVPIIIPSEWGTEAGEE